MPTLHFTRGLPASGKTTWARTWTAENARAGCVSTGRPARHARFQRAHQGRHREARDGSPDATVLKLLRQGYDVVCDDTNLPQRVARDLARLADRAGAELQVHDFTHVPLETCLERDAAREASVGEDTIRGLHQRFLAGKSLPLPLPEEDPRATLVGLQYEPKPGSPKALVDIDGTVALMDGRSPFDETRVHQDLPNAPVISVVRACTRQASASCSSGRTDRCRTATEAWLDEHVGVPYG
ncbi:AAA family ATPase, partial [Streptomyces sp. FXJ1.4098]|nr:AAA family ATPase [Streptomyces sp. FXJ1.4098]